VFLGTALLTGPLVLGATIRRSFNNLLSTVNSGVDVLVRRAEAGSTGGGEDFGVRQRGRLDASLVDVVRAVPGVAAAEGTVQTGGVQLLDKSGQPLLGGGRGAPALGGSWRNDAALNPFRLVAGHPPSAPDDVVIDRASADKGHFHVGDTITILTPDPHAFRVSGI